MARVARHDLVALLELELLDRDLFRGHNERGARDRLSLYGGQVAAQALRAAGATVPSGRLPHSLHGYFLRPGRTDLPVIFHVDRDRDGGSFSARHVRAVQDGEVIFSMLASFHEREAAATFDAVATRGGAPADTLPARPSPLLVDVREVTPTRIADGQVRHSDRLWVRAATRLPDDPLMHACALAYVSDLGSGFGQVEVPELSAGGPSIDHSLWFQEPIHADEWMLLELWPMKAGGARGVYGGSLRSEDGRLGAVMMQEMLLRPPRDGSRTPASPRRVPRRHGRGVMRPWETEARVDDHRHRPQRPEEARDPTVQAHRHAPLPWLRMREEFGRLRHGVRSFRPVGHRRAGRPDPRRYLCRPQHVTVRLNEASTEAPVAEL
jgi:acyl-CoA thioesterase-2